MQPVTHWARGKKELGKVNKRGAGTLTQHFIPGHIDACHAEGRIRVRRVVVDGELPVVDAAGEPYRAEGHTVLPALDANGGIVFAKD